MDRLVDPLLKVKGGWKKIGWPEALGRYAAEMNRLRNNPQAILRLTGRLLFGLLGASTTKDNLCNAAGVAAMKAD